MACSHKEAIDENAAVEEVQEPEFIVREWYPTPKRSVVQQPGYAMPPGQARMTPVQPQQQAWPVTPPQYQYPQYPSPTPAIQPPTPAPVTQPQASVPQQQGQMAPYYQYAPRPWGPQPQPQSQQQAQVPGQYNPWQAGAPVPPGYGAVPVYPGWGGPGIWAGTPRE